MYKGSTQVTATITNIDFIPYEGLTVTYSDNTFTVSVNSNLTTSVAQSGTLYITATTSDNNSFEKTFNWSLASMKEEGKAGVNGFNSTTVLLYQRYFVQPSNKPQNISYNFDTHRAIIPQESLWSDSIPSGTDPCWVSAATAIIEATVSPAIDNIADTEWSDPILLVQDGKDGLSQAKITLYKRALTKPSDAEKPGNLTYTFANGSLTPSENFNGWSLNIPEIGNNTPSPCWITTGVAISAAASDVIDSWAEPVQYIEKNIYSITEYYARNNSSTIAPTNNWSTPPIPTPTQDAKYIWNYELITYTDGTTNATSTGSTVHIAATYGADGKGITGITNYYARTNTPNAPTKGTTSPWSTTPQTVNANNKYLWNYEIISYTTGDPTETNVHLIGAYGDAGIYPTSITEEYIKTTSSTDEPEESASGWDVNPPIWESGKYIWTRSKIIWSDDNSPNNPHIDYTTPVLANSYNSIGEIAAAANETANSASEDARNAVESASQAFATASTAVQYAEVANLAASAAVACANTAYNASVSAQASADQAASAAATAQASANAAISAAASAVESASVAFDASVSASNAAASAVTSASVAYNAAASAVACASAAFNAAASAQTSASQAAQSANSAALSASAAETSANTASAAAVSAENSALLASQRADLAQSAAISASAAASAAVQSASVAITSASLAVQSASQAATSADQAAQSASAAVTSASLAAQSASAANIAANSALTQLSIVEDVAGTLDWISKHGSYTPTTDTTVQDGIVYFVQSGSSEPYTYTPVTDPEGNPKSQGWYVLDITDSQSKYIMAHLAVTSAGLWVLPSTVENYVATTHTTVQQNTLYYTRSGSIGNYTYAPVATPSGNPKAQGWYVANENNGYKVLLSNSGMSVYDNSGTIVATYGEGISFDSNRSFTIGDASASITFDGNGHITISGSGVNIGSTVSIGGLNGAINEAINNLEIGGRNLLKYSQDYNIGYSSSTAESSIDGTYRGCSVWKAVKTATNAYNEALSTDASKVAAWIIGPDEDYVLSFWAKASTQLQIYSFFYLGGNNTCDKVETSTGYSGTATDGSAVTTIGTDWERYWVHWHFNSTTDPTKRKNLIIARLQNAVTGTVWIAGPKLEKGNKATDWTPAPEDVEASISNVETTANNAAPKASAVKRTQRIYYRTSSSMTSWTMPTKWLATTGDVFNQWTCKVPRMTANADGTGTKYLYLYTCEQREMANGTLEYTTVLLDDSTTIIDGGNIITGSITANAIQAGTITAGLINTTNLHVNAANIDGTITAAQINTTDLTVSAANIIGTITASQIDVTNSLTIGDLTIEARNDLVKPINEELSDLNSDLSNLSEDAVLKSKDTWTAWMDVGTDSNNDPYLTMGQSGNAFESRLTNRYMSFNEGTVELMRLSGEDGVKADIIRSKYVYIGSWILEQLDNGDMAIKLVGGE